MWLGLEAFRQLSCLWWAADRGGVLASVSHGETGLSLSAPVVDEVFESVRTLLEDHRFMSSMGQRALKRALECSDAKGFSRSPY